MTGAKKNLPLVSRGIKHIPLRELTRFHFQAEPREIDLFLGNWGLDNSLNGIL